MGRLVKILVVIGVAALIIVGGVAAFARFGSERKMHRTVELSVEPVTVPTDQVSLDRGRYLYESRGCRECHGADGAGKVIIDDGGFYVKSPHISAGSGSTTADYAEADWVRAIRHGVKPNGEPILVMPSEDYDRLTDQDVGAAIAYVRSLPPVDGTGAELRIPLQIRFLYAAGFIQDAAEKIDHTLPPRPSIGTADVVAQGAYVAELCMGCHNESLSGGPIPGGDPNWPPAVNLTPGEGGVMGRYPTPDALADMFRSGKRPDGSAVSDAMPFDALKALSDEDVAALHAFINTLTPRKTGEQG